MKKYLLITSLMIAPAISNAQLGVAKPCSSPELIQFDFWLGDWELIWNDTSKGTNTITRIMDGCALHENFNDPALNYKGESWTVYDPSKKSWQQTWIDNQGGYIVLSGKYQDKKMTLSAQPKLLPDGKKSTSRMVFENIRSDSFDWRWESTTDGGTTWKLNWLIHYKRKN